MISKKNHALEIIFFFCLYLMLIKDISLVLILSSILIYLLYVFIGNGRIWNFAKKALAILSVIIPFVVYGKLRSVEASVGVLAYLTVLKHTEINSIRDRLSFYSLTFLFICSSLILSNQIIYLLMATGMIFLCFRHILQIKKINLKISRFKTVILSATSFTLLIYLALPQLQLGNMFKYRSTQARSGFSNSISPGSFKELILDNEPIFLAYMKSRPVDGYWKGIVLDRTDGRAWYETNTRGKKVTSEVNLKSFADINLLVDYKLPLFYLYESSPMGNYYVNRSGVYKANRSVRKYSLSSNITNVTAPTGRNLSLPKSFSKTRLASELAELRDKDTDNKLAQLIEVFKSFNLTYSLSTDIDRSKNMDHFLFDSKKGYCEHFASSFALALRFIGIPANVIGGFYGGNYNKYGGFILIKGKDAHSWVEYWDGDKWVSIDPVSILASSSVLPQSNYMGLEQLDFIANEDISTYSDISNYLENIYLKINSEFFRYDLDMQKEIFIALQTYVKNMDSKKLSSILRTSLVVIVITLLLCIAFFFALLPDKLFLYLVGVQNFTHFSSLKKYLSTDDFAAFEHLFDVSQYSPNGLNLEQSQRLKRLKYSILLQLIRSKFSSQ